MDNLGNVSNVMLLKILSVTNVLVKKCKKW